MRAFALKGETFFCDPEGEIGIHRSTQQLPMGQHRHDFTELALVAGGSGIHVTCHFRQEITRGDVLVITDRRAHGYEKTDNLHLINILIRDAVLPRLGRDLKTLPGYKALFGRASGRSEYISYLRMPAGEFLQIEEWATRIGNEAAFRTQAGRLLAEAYLTLIIGSICRTDRQVTRARQASRFAGILNYLERHLDEPIRVADLAARASMSERTFYREFRKVVGDTPTDFLLKTRIRHAANLLTSGKSERRISEIANACGFDDSNYFSRVFRRLTNLSPREYRSKSSG